MTPITYLNRSSSETEPVRLCRRKSMECRWTALAATDPAIRLRYLHLANLWMEMADEAERKTNGSSPSEERGVVIFLNQFQNRSKAVLDQGRATEVAVVLKS